MKRCTSCFRYSLGEPVYCTHCGRSYNVRICARGHSNARGAAFCAECGSGDLSTPGAPAGFLFYFSQWALRILIGAAIGILILSAVVGFFASLDWDAIAPRLVLLGLMLAFLYWTTTLLPGPVKKLGKAAGSQAWKAMTGKGKSK
ncbi:MAG: zinc ribbon domain-containing protein [Hyphomicrobium sp.]